MNNVLSISFYCAILFFINTWAYPQQQRTRNPYDSCLSSCLIGMNYNPIHGNHSTNVHFIARRQCEMSCGPPPTVAVKNQNPFLSGFYVPITTTTTTRATPTVAAKKQNNPFLQNQESITKLNDNDNSNKQPTTTVSTIVTTLAQKNHPTTTITAPQEHSNSGAIDQLTNDHAALTKVQVDEREKEEAENSNKSTTMETLQQYGVCLSNCLMKKDYYSVESTSHSLRIECEKNCDTRESTKIIPPAASTVVLPQYGACLSTCLMKKGYYALSSSGSLSKSMTLRLECQNFCDEALQIENN